MQRRRSSSREMIFKCSGLFLPSTVFLTSVTIRCRAPALMSFKARSDIRLRMSWESSSVSLKPFRSSTFAKPGSASAQPVSQPSGQSSSLTSSLVWKISSNLAATYSVESSNCFCRSSTVKPSILAILFLCSGSAAKSCVC